MSTLENKMDQLTRVFDAYSATLNGKSHSPLHVFRTSAFQALKGSQFPDRKMEDWKYTPVQQLLTPEYDLADFQDSMHLADIPGLSSYVISVINGQALPVNIDPGLRQAGVRIVPLMDAFQDEVWNATFLPLLALQPNQASHAFDYLNYAFCESGFFIDIPAGLILDAPIEIRIVHASGSNSFSHPLYFVRSGAGSSVTVIERFGRSNGNSGSDQEHLVNMLSFFQIDKQAELNHIKWQHLPENQNLVYKLSARQQRDSRFTSIAIDAGGHIVRNNIEIELEDQQTSTKLLGGFMAMKKQSMDHHTRINHTKPHCESYEHYKGIIGDQARASFHGKVYVHSDAQKTNAYQQNDALVVSPHAIMNSKPQLEIFADDVRCSHGATIGQLDEKLLYYLRSRGLTAERAAYMLKAAFLSVILEDIPIEPLRNHIASEMQIEL